MYLKLMNEMIAAAEKTGPERQQAIESSEARLNWCLTFWRRFRVIRLAAGRCGIVLTRRCIWCTASALTALTMADDPRRRPARPRTWSFASGARTSPHKLCVASAPSITNPMAVSAA